MNGKISLNLAFSLSVANALRVLVYQLGSLVSIPIGNVIRVRLGSAFCASQTHVYVSENFFFPSRNFLTFLPRTVFSCTVHGPHKPHFSATFSLKMGPTVLFTHLKIILLQCFSVFSFQLYPNGTLVIALDSELQKVRKHKDHTNYPSINFF